MTLLGSPWPPAPLAGSYLRVLPVAAADLRQALPGSSAGWRGRECLLHFAGSILEASLDTVCFVEFVHLSGVTGGNTTDSTVQPRSEGGTPAIVQSGRCLVSDPRKEALVEASSSYLFIYKEYIHLFGAPG